MALNAAVAQLPSQQSIAGEQNKLAQVQRLLDVLKLDLAENNNLTPQKRAETLEQLKIFGRDPHEADPIFTQEGIEILCRQGFNTTDDTSSREAWRCIANALLIVPETRQTFVDLGFAEKAAERYKSELPDDEFLLGRMLFLVTYNTTADFLKLLEQHHLEEHINNAIIRHSKAYSKNLKSKIPSPMQDMALSETLKLIFNISHKLPEDAHHFARCVSNIFKILSRRRLADPPLQAPVIHLINVLLGLDMKSCQAHAFPMFDSHCNVGRLIEILDLSTSDEYTKVGVDADKAFDEVGIPLLTLLRTMHETAPDSTKKYMKSRLLPSEEERDQPLGRSSSLPSRLLRLSSSAAAPNTREHISSLLFELSSSNPEEFVDNVGYGFASGFLMTKKLPVPQSALDSNASARSSKPINPITGQTLESEPRVNDPFEGMTDEEKEREAERLFVLFERLKKTGVINVQNPVEQAVQEGRFEEIE